MDSEECAASGMLLTPRQTRCKRVNVLRKSVRLRSIVTTLALQDRSGSLIFISN